MGRPAISIRTLPGRREEDMRAWIMANLLSGISGDGTRKKVISSQGYMLFQAEGSSVPNRHALQQFDVLSYPFQEGDVVILWHSESQMPGHQHFHPGTSTLF